MTKHISGRRGPMLGALSVVAWSALGCADRTAPNQLAAVGVAPVFAPGAEAQYASARLLGLVINAARFRLDRPGGGVVVDTTVTISPTADEIVIDVVVPLVAPSERLNALLELRNADIVLFAGTTSMVAIAGPLPQIPVIELTYVGPLEVPELPLPEEPVPELPLPELPLPPVLPPLPSLP